MMIGDISIGIMQGRLSDKPGQPLQSFPHTTWQEEFYRAANIGFDNIEWLVDSYDVDKNPLFSSKGQNAIQEASNESGISINSLCAHVFIDGDLLFDKSTHSISNDFLAHLFDVTSKLNIESIILPAMDSMSLTDEANREILLTKLNKLLSGDGPLLLLETDMHGELLLNVLQEFNNKRLGILYDLGNSNALNFDAITELELLNDFIFEIHLKDRDKVKGISHRLGDGDTPFFEISKKLTYLKWCKRIVLETPIFQNWELEAKNNFEFSKNIFSDLSN